MPTLKFSRIDFGTVYPKSNESLAYTQQQGKITRQVLVHKAKWITISTLNLLLYPDLFSSF